jgi:hypothetical protein
MDLAENQLTLSAMQCPPAPDPPLERPSHVRLQRWIPALQFLEDRHWPHLRRGHQHRHDIGIKDFDQRIGSAPPSRRLLLRR